MSNTFTITRRVEFAETDMAGVLHFANYYRLMEEVEHAFWRSQGTSVLFRIKDREMSWPRVATKCEYFAPARFEDELLLSLKVTHVGDRSATFEIEFTRDGERLALGRTTVVCCTMIEGKFQSISIPDPLRNKLNEAVESESPA